MTARWITGDTRKVMAGLPDGSVDLVLTSPPFLALRSYLPDDHPDKASEIGSEATPGDFIDALLDVTEECSRLLAPHGTLAVELGDTYAGGGVVGVDRDTKHRRVIEEDEVGRAHGTDPMRQHSDDLFNAKSNRRWRTTDKGTGGRPGWPMDKSLSLVPESYRWALAYGRNPFNGRPTPPWRVRNVVRWVRPNPPVGNLGDKFRPGTSELVIACKARDRWFDLDAVRTKADPANERTSSVARKGIGARSDQVMNPVDEDGHRIISNPAGAPPLDWWNISSGGFPGSHYAVYPPELCRIPIEAMCPRRVCRGCGEPSRRIVDAKYLPDTSGGGAQSRRDAREPEGNHRGMMGGGPRLSVANETTGWSSCGCPGTDGIRLDGFHTGLGWRPGVVLDPFAGTGTTLVVATGRGRDAIGIDLDDRNTQLAIKRVGMFLEHE